MLQSSNSESKEEVKNENPENVEMVDEKADTAVKTDKNQDPENVEVADKVAYKRWLGIYELQETLGGGGYSLVEIGCDPKTKQQVAIKMKKPSLGEYG